MHNISYFKSFFIEKHGNPDDVNALDEYLSLTTEYGEDISEGYSEVHHILPKSTFPEHKTAEWNLVRLLYKDHVKAHQLLFIAYNIKWQK